MILDKEARPETVTGIVTTYRREAAIVEHAISSMLMQTYPLLEIIVVDDNVNESRLCSQIQDMCGKYQNVIYIKQDGNKYSSGSGSIEQDQKRDGIQKRYRPFSTDKIFPLSMISAGTGVSIS